jgi:fructokinase
MPPLLAAVELGGTKILAAVGEDPLRPLRQTRIATEQPDRSLAAVADFFEECRAAFGAPAALGIGSFGPVHIRRNSPDWGRTGRTPKPGWEGVDIAGRLGAALGCPVGLDTDANGAALAEARWGAGCGLSSLAYLTVGTGIGGGIVIDGRAVHGAMHPEIGHIRLQRHETDDYAGSCRFHGNCAEGLASGPAIMARFGCSLDRLPPDHPFRDTLADYLGQLCATLVLVASPELIVIGGGVMTGATLHPEVEGHMRHWIGHYVEAEGPNGGAFIVPPALGDLAGLAGGFALAQDALAS